MGRILYVISSFDRGERLGKKFRQQSDKMDFVLMMLDEMREACEVGARPGTSCFGGRTHALVAPMARSIGIGDDPGFYLGDAKVGRKCPLVPWYDVGKN